MLLIWVSLSCFHFNDNDTSISISETKTVYKMSAHFSRNKTKAVHEYIDRQTGKANNISFLNSEADATVMLHDKTSFYLKSLPGELEIKLDKQDNSYESFARVKEMCEGIKKVIEKQ